MTGWSGVYMVFMSVVWLVAVVVVTWSIVAILRSGVPTPSRRDRRTSREVLDERLARGELELDEYRKLRAAIADSVSPRRACATDVAMTTAGLRPAERQPGADDDRGLKRGVR